MTLKCHQMADGGRGDAGGESGLPAATPCGFVRTSRPCRVSRFLSHLFAQAACFSRKTAVVTNPTRGAFFAGCRTGSQGAGPTTPPVSILVDSGGALAAGFGILNEPRSGRPDRKSVETGAEQATEIGAIKSQQNIGRREGTEQDRRSLFTGNTAGLSIVNTSSTRTS